MNPFIFSSNTGKFSSYFLYSANFGCKFWSVSSSKWHPEQKLTDWHPELQKSLTTLGNSGGTAKVRGLEAFPFLCRSLYVVKGKPSHQPQLLWALICSSQALTSLFFSLIHGGGGKKPSEDTHFLNTGDFTEII